MDILRQLARSLWVASPTVLKWFLAALRWTFVPSQDYNHVIPTWLKKRHEVNVGGEDREYITPQRPTSWDEHPPTLRELTVYTPTRITPPLDVIRWLPTVGTIAATILLFVLGVPFIMILSSVILAAATLRFLQWLSVFFWWTDTDYFMRGQISALGLREGSLPGVYARKGRITAHSEWAEASTFTAPRFSFPRPQWFWSMKWLNIGHAFLSVKTQSGETRELKYRWRRFPSELVDLFSGLAGMQEADAARTAEAAEATVNLLAVASYWGSRQRGLSRATALEHLRFSGVDPDQLDDLGLFDEQPDTATGSDDTVEIPTVSPRGTDWVV